MRNASFDDRTSVIESRSSNFGNRASVIDQRTRGLCDRPALAGLSLAAPVALAGEKAPAAEEKALPKIEKSGIAEFDTVFMKARAIHDTLDAEDKTLTGARTNVNSVLGVATDAPLATAFADLKTKANGKLKIALKGTVPRLEASDALPDNAQKGLDAANSLVDAAVHAIASGKELEPEAKALAAAVVEFPASAECGWWGRGGAPERQAWPESGPGEAVEALRVRSEKV